MPFSWSGKKQGGGPDLFEDPSAPAPADKTPGDLETLAESLEGLGNLLGRVQGQIAAHLVRREAEAAAGSGSAGLAEKIDALARKLDALSQGAASGGPTPGQATDEALRRLERHLQEGLAQLADRLAPPKKAVATRATSTDWERAILGPVLADNPALDFQRQQLVRGVLDADPAACSLAGQLLVFRSAAAERMPQLLKEIGEAYYRWQPKTRPGANPMEQALVAWLGAVCEKAGIGNTIELVHPGERFDSARHTSTTRGVEITAVGGWIVLRDNGKVYTKASVAAK